MTDYLIVGAGLFGSVVAHELYKAGKSVRVIDKRNHVGGNCYTKKVNGITIHVYGPHVFHTDDQRAWDYVNQFTEFKPFVNRPKIFYDGKFYSFPINLMTMNQAWGVITPDEARKKLNGVSCHCHDTGLNFEDWLVSKIGYELYKMFYESYTEKLWGVSPKDLPADFAKRVPVRFDFNDNYYDDKYQGIPQNGYAGLFDRLLEGIQVNLNTSHSGRRGGLIIYTGRIDQYYDYRFGKLDYRDLFFVEEWHDTEDFQGGPVINYPEKKFAHVRVTEHKHFLGEKCPTTVTTTEFPIEYGVPCYPVRTQKNLERLAKYQELATKEKNVIFGGRLASFEYLNMDEIVLRALKCTKENEFV